MAKAIPRISSRRNGRIGSRKSARRIPKGVIHVQASFNNTIVTVTDVRGRVVSWSSAVALLLQEFSCSDLTKKKGFRGYFHSSIGTSFSPQEVWMYLRKWSTEQLETLQ
jgi:hypothetical protein